MDWDGEEYQRRFDRLAAEGAAVHGEADFVMDLQPRRVLDAGCGTGRVAVELARRGVDVVGVDADASMIEAARSRRPDLTWVLADLTSPDLDIGVGAVFDVVVMAGNVPLFTPPGSETALVAACARLLVDGGALVAGFGLGRGYSLAAYDLDAERAGLERVERYATWARAAFSAASSYAVSVHRRRR